MPQEEFEKKKLFSDFTKDAEVWQAFISIYVSISLSRAGASCCSRSNIYRIIVHTVVLLLLLLKLRI